MRSFKNYLIAFLALTTFASGYLAWQQSQDLAALRANAKTDDDRAALRKRVWDAEKRTQALEADLAAAHAERPAGPAGPAATAGTTAGGPERMRRGEGQFMGLMENPEYQKLMALQQKGMLDGRYAALFKKLGLNPQQLENFKRLLVEKQTSMMDVLAAARAQGLDPRSDPEAFRQLVTGAQGEIDESIKSALGATAYNEYKNYETTLPYRGMVNQLEQRLSYGNTPLTESQSQAMLQIFSETAPQPASGSTPMVATRVAATTMLGGAPGGGNVVTMLGGGGGQITNEALSRAQGVLAADQMAALQQLQQEHQAQAQMGQLMRSQFGRGGEPAPGTTTTTTTVIAAPVTR